MGLVPLLGPCLLLRFLGVFLHIGFDPGRRRFGPIVSLDQRFQFLHTELEAADLLPEFHVLGEETLKSF